ncbi:MAG: acyl-CoA dehydrogenase family protein [Clostridia bacterium]|nr:acyl-CoA dehydrogenase family protein [Deltaproteobacteria bacterium]
MMFALTDNQEQVRSSTERLARERLAPTARERDVARTIPHELLRTLGENGLLAMTLPGELSGSELDVVSYALAIREIAKADASVAVTVAVTNMVGEVIKTFGNPAQCERHIPNLASGEYFAGSFALSESSCGSDAANLTTRARRTDKGWAITGEKAWITSGHKAGVFVVWARTSDDGARGITCFLVRPGTPGFSVGKAEDKMGQNASHTVSLAFDNVEVAADAVLGEIGAGFRIAMTALDGGRIGVGALAAGIATAALGKARAYVRERKQFGKALADFQGTQFALADMATELDAGWLLVLRAAWLKEQRRPFTREAAMAKVFMSEASNRVVREAVQLLGGYGYMEEYDVARYYRDARVTQIYEGTSEIQRMVIARDLLRC